MFETEIEGLDELHNALADELVDLRRELTSAVDDACKTGADAARSGHKYTDRTGALSGSISGKVVAESFQGAQGEIAVTAPYARAINDGSKAHEIRPKESNGFVGPLKEGQSRRKRTDIGTHRSALRWVDGAGTHFATVVHHPGTKAEGFMEVGREAAESKLQHNVETAAERMIERCGK